MDADYKKYAKAHTYITNNPGCEFILTNADPTYPAGGAFFPGKFQRKSLAVLGAPA
jgi:ribonucleotide monophosphatase NagD (HAD superfamily)